jgi:FtsH-binding integral membrane protein
MGNIISSDRTRVEVIQSEFIRAVYNWMGLGLATTAVVAMATAKSSAMQRLIFGNPLIFFGLIIGELALVLALSTAINRIRASSATIMFFVSSIFSSRVKPFTG